MPSKHAYSQLRDLILHENSPVYDRAGHIACRLMEKHHGELVELGFIPAKESFEAEDLWRYEGDIYGLLIPKVKRQLENLVAEGRLRKVYDEGTHGRRNFKHRIVRYIPAAREDYVEDSKR